MHFCVDYFVTDSRHTPQVTYAPVGFQPEFTYCPSKNGECSENEIIKVGCLFTFLKGELQILPLTGRKNPSNVRCSNSAFLHGVEWDRLLCTEPTEGSFNELLHI